MKGSDLFHTGIVTADFDATIAELSDRFGYEWGREYAAPNRVTLPDGDITIDLHFVYSRTQPRLEIIEAVPGTLWMPVEGSGVHHLGFWSNDLAADHGDLLANGYVAEALGVRPDAVPHWGYYCQGNGPRIELIDAAIAPSMEQLWS